tara:strand:+ start:1986 stop:2246 length:261 start_codon:yes stop_codon:yes gene_type:complete
MKKQIADAIMDEIVALVERGDHKLPSWDEKDGELPMTHPDYMGFIPFARDLIRQYFIDNNDIMVEDGFARGIEMWFDEVLDIEIVI